MAAPLVSCTRRPGGERGVRTLTCGPCRCHPPLPRRKFVVVEERKDHNEHQPMPRRLGSKCTLTRCCDHDTKTRLLAKTRGITNERYMEATWNVKKEGYPRGSIASQTTRINERRVGIPQPRVDTKREPLWACKCMFHDRDRWNGPNECKTSVPLHAMVVSLLNLSTKLAAFAKFLGSSLERHALWSNRMNRPTITIRENKNVRTTRMRAC